MTPEERRQVQAAYAALTAAQLALEAILEAAPAARPAPPEPIDEDAEPACPHSNREPASTMMTEPRDYCRDCRSFVYADGRVEAVG